MKGDIGEAIGKTLRHRLIHGKIRVETVEVMDSALRSTCVVFHGVSKGLMYCNRRMVNRKVEE